MMMRNRIDTVPNQKMIGFEIDVIASTHWPTSQDEPSPASE